MMIHPTNAAFADATVMSAWRTIRFTFRAQRPSIGTLERSETMLPLKRVYHTISIYRYSITVVIASIRLFLSHAFIQFSALTWRNIEANGLKLSPKGWMGWPKG